MQAIQLIVGLGNPGDEYSKTRHNAGFWWVDQVCQHSNTRLQTEAKFHGQAGKLTGREVWLLKPDTFMNGSGRAVSALAKFYKIPVQAILVVHDELDLPVGAVKLKKAGGHGGHNGLRDIIAHMGSADFWRLRVGIGHPGKQAEGGRDAVVNFVLRPPSRPEMALIEQGIDASTALIERLLAGDFEQAMLQLHTKTESLK